MGEVALIRLQPRKIHGQRDSLLLPRERKRICECEGLHDRRNLVIPVIPKSQNIERQIDLRPSENRYHRKPPLLRRKLIRAASHIISLSFYFQINRIFNYIQ